nr:MAG TPA: hypothetical protein [Caudoviricetes sp.]
MTKTKGDSQYFVIVVLLFGDIDTLLYNKNRSC